MLDRSHLMVVREVERQGSLTAAADTLNLTQSALSHAVKKLEQQLGTPVWTREGRAMRLTQAGQYLLRLANRMLPQFELAEERMKQYAQGERGTLRIGMECHPCYQWLLKVVSPYLKDWPDVDVDVKQRFQFGGIGALFGFARGGIVPSAAGGWALPSLGPGGVLARLHSQEMVLPANISTMLQGMARSRVRRGQLFAEYRRPGLANDDRAIQFALTRSHSELSGLARNAIRNGWR